MSDDWSGGQFEFGVLCTKLPGGKGRVEIGVGEGDTEVPFEAMMMAAEFLTHLVCQRSGAGYEKALDLVREGAMTYKDPRRKG